MTRLVRALPALTLVAVLVVTATSEFRLAVDVLALPPWVAWGVPAAVDSYVVAAVRTRRDVAPAMGVMAVSLFAAAGSHIVQAHTGGALPIQVTGPASAAMLSVLVLVAWRVHVLIDRISEGDAPSEPATSLDVADHAPTQLALEEPRTSPAPPAITSGTGTPSSAASPPAAAQASSSSSAGASAARRPGTSGRSGGGRAAVEPTGDLLEAFRAVVKDLRHQKLTVNYKNVAPRLRDRGHPAGRAKVDGLIAEHAQPQLQAV